MEKDIFDGIIRGLGDVKRYMQGDSSGMVVHHVEVPQQVDVKAREHQKPGDQAARGSSSSCRSGYHRWNTAPSS
jgi:hypothetical protein